MRSTIYEKRGEIRRGCGSGKCSTFLTDIQIQCLGRVGIASARLEISLAYPTEALFRGGTDILLTCMLCTFMHYTWRIAVDAVIRNDKPSAVRIVRKMVLLVFLYQTS